MKFKTTNNLLAFALMTIFCLTGCGKSSEGEQVKRNENAIFTGKIENGVTIKVLENDTAISKGYFADLIKAFNEEYADKGIKAVDANTDQYVDLANDGPYGYGPDVLYQANDVIMKYADSKHIYPLPIDQLDAYKTTSPNAWSAFEIKKEGKTYTCGVPVNVQAPVLYYRKDLLPNDWRENWDDNKNQIPDMVETWSKLVDFSRQRHAVNPTQYGYMESLYDTYFSSGYLFSYGAYIFGQGNTDTKDIGFSKGEAEKGANIIQQLASVMNEESIDNTIKSSAYSKLGDGTYFATMSTPDVYSTFLDEIVKNYESQGKTKEEAQKLAKENLVVTSLPKLPKSGDLNDVNSELIDNKMMGGINGYAISAYTKAPNASLAFVNFATRYQMVMKRYEKLGIVPTQKDVVDKIGGISKVLHANLEKGNIITMPSISAVSQIWTPTQTYFSDITKDVFRPENEKKYKTLADLKSGLKDVDKQISDAIHTLE